MKTITSLLLCLSILGHAAAQQHKAKFSIEGRLTRTSAFCGGAMPTEEMQKEFSTPAPYPGVKLYVRQGNKNDTTRKIIAVVQSDANGHFRFRLPVGTYCIVGADKMNSQLYHRYLREYRKPGNSYSAIDPACLYNWLQEPLLVFTVRPTRNSKLDINIHQACSWDLIPCVTYNGPFPP